MYVNNCYLQSMVLCSSFVVSTHPHLRSASGKIEVGRAVPPSSTSLEAGFVIGLRFPSPRIVSFTLHFQQHRTFLTNMTYKSHLPRLEFISKQCLDSTEIPRIGRDPGANGCTLL